jgi:hypothetical protein
MVGHVDYTCGNSANPTLAAFSLTHLPGVIQHGPFSTNFIPALSTGTTSYHLVGPAPFTFAPVFEPQGILNGESARSSTMFVNPFFYQCHGETDTFLGGSLLTNVTTCLGASSGSPLWHHQNLQAAFTCASFPVTFQSIPVPGTPINITGFLGMSLGSYGSGLTFPHNREVVVYFGLLYNANFTCSPVLSPLQIVTGVGTTTAIPGRPLSGTAGTPNPPASTFIDLQNYLPISLWPTSGGIPSPGYGSLFLPDLVLSVNLP